MGKSIRIDAKSLYKGIGKVLQSKDLADQLKKVADEKKGDWQTDTRQMPTRVIASIYSSDTKKIAEELLTHKIVGGLR